MQTHNVKILSYYIEFWDCKNLQLSFCMYFVSCGIQEPINPTCKLIMNTLATVHDYYVDIHFSYIQPYPLFSKIEDSTSQDLKQQFAGMQKTSETLNAGMKASLHEQLEKQVSSLILWVNEILQSGWSTASRYTLPVPRIVL